MTESLCYKITEEMEVKLEGKKTNIYINDKYISMCKYLLVVLTPSNFDKINKIESIDDLSTYQTEYQATQFKIPPEDEFWGHCSNLQAWIEHDCDCRLLHSSLSWPLLKELSLANPKYKEFLIKQIDEKYIANKKLIDYFIPSPSTYDGWRFYKKFGFTPEEISASPYLRDKMSQLEAYDKEMERRRKALEIHTRIDEGFRQIADTWYTSFTMWLRIRGTIYFFKQRSWYRDYHIVAVKFNHELYIKDFSGDEEQWRYLTRGTIMDYLRFLARNFGNGKEHLNRTRPKEFLKLLEDNNLLLNKI